MSVAVPIAIKDRYNVLDFGAVADGVTDTSAALLAAVAAANAVPGVVYVPAGTYILKQPIILETDNITIEGDGAATVIDFLPETTGQIAIDISELWNIRLANFTLKNSQVTSGCDYGIKFTNSNNCRVDGVNLEGRWLENGVTPRYGFAEAGIWLNDDSGGSGNNSVVTISNTSITGCQADGVNISGDMGSLYNIIDSFISGCDGYCIQNNSTAAHTLNIQGTVVQGGYLGLVKTTQLYSSSFTNNHFEASGSNTAIPIVFSQPATGLIETRSFSFVSNNVGHGLADYAIEFATSHGISGITIAGNIFSGSSGKKILHTKHTCFNLFFGQNFAYGYGTTVSTSLVDLGTYYAETCWIQGREGTTYKGNSSNGAPDPAVNFPGVLTVGALTFGGTMGNSSKVPGTDAPADWVEIKIGTSTYYLPAYAA